MTDLTPLYRKMAADGANFRGLTVLNHAKQIGRLIKEHKARTVLDYGCGAGDAYKQPHRVHREWGMRWWDITLYDPAFPQHDEKPGGMFDGVLCSDVLEHVPEDQVDALLALLFKHARSFVWASVCCREAKKCFPDGTNLHVTIRPIAWWRERIELAARIDGRGIPFTLEETP